MCEVSQYLNFADLISAFSIIRVHYNGKKPELKNRICSSLISDEVNNENDNVENEEENTSRNRKCVLTGVEFS